MRRPNQESSTCERRPERSARQSCERAAKAYKRLDAVRSGETTVEVGELRIAGRDRTQIVATLRVVSPGHPPTSARFGPRTLRVLIAALERTGREVFGERWQLFADDHDDERDLANQPRRRSSR